VTSAFGGDTDIRFQDVRSDFDPTETLADERQNAATIKRAGPKITVIGNIDD
jgi:hypothetical protein